jgi:hypothetical protein
MIVTVAVQLALAAALAVLGRWGSRHTATPAETVLPAHQHQRKLRTIRRGALTCYIAAAFLALTAIPITR